MKRYLLNYFPYFLEMGVKKTQQEHEAVELQNQSIDDGYMKCRFLSLAATVAPILWHESP